jgi:hypothetical protein
MRVRVKRRQAGEHQTFFQWLSSVDWQRQQKTLRRCGIVADKLFSAQQAEQSTYFDLRVRMINSDMRTGHGIKRAHLYEVWRGSQSVYRL